MGTKATMLVRIAKVTGTATSWVPSIEAVCGVLPLVPKV